MKRSKTVVLIFIFVMMFVVSCSSHKDPQTVILDNSKHEFCSISSVKERIIDSPCDSRVFNEGLFSVEYGEQDVTLKIWRVDGSPIKEYDLSFPLQIVLGKIYVYDDVIYSIGYSAVGCVLIGVSDNDYSFEVVDQAVEYRDIFVDKDSIYLVSDYEVVTLDRTFRKKGIWKSESYLHCAVLIQDGIAVCTEENANNTLVKLDQNLNVVCEISIISENGTVLELAVLQDDYLCLIDDYGIYKLNANDLSCELLCSYSDFGICQLDSVFCIDNELFFEASDPGCDLIEVYSLNYTEKEKRSSIDVLAATESKNIISALCGRYNMENKQYYILVDYVNEESTPNIANILSSGKYDLYMGDVSFLNMIHNCSDLNLSISDNVNRELVNYDCGKYLVGFRCAGNAYRNDKAGITYVEDFFEYRDFVYKRNPNKVYYENNTFEYISDLICYIEKGIDAGDEELLADVFEYISNEANKNAILTGTVENVLKDDLLFLDSQIDNIDQLISMERYIDAERFGILCLSDVLYSDSGLAVCVGDNFVNKEMVQEFISFLLSDSAQKCICREMFPVNVNGYHMYVDDLGLKKHYLQAVRQEYKYLTDSEKKEEEKAIKEYISQVGSEGVGDHSFLDDLIEDWDITDEELVEMIDLGEMIILDTEEIRVCDKGELGIVNEELDIYMKSHKRNNDVIKNLISRVLLHKAEFE